MIIAYGKGNDKSTPMDRALESLYTGRERTHRGNDMRRIASLGMVIALAACGGETKDGCVQGATQECLCVSGGSGVQTCMPGGNAWGGCMGCEEQPDDAVRGADLTSSDISSADASSGDVSPIDIPLLDVPPLDILPVDVPQGDLPPGEDSVSPEDGIPDQGPPPPDGSCVPDCEDKECGDDGCGGLCNDCLDIIYDDGTTETAYGYAAQPQTDPQRIACVVRYELPHTDMRLLRFTAGWMWGLYNLQIPFELAYVPGDGVECEEGTEQSWYNEYCQTTPDQFVSIGDFLPVMPYDPMDADLLGEVIFPTKTIYLAAIFDVDEYPIFVCPMDQSGDGSLAYMMPQYEKTQGIIVAGASFDRKETNAGVIPFSIRVEKTN